MDERWIEMEQRHRAFWTCTPVERPLVMITQGHYIDTEWVAGAMGNGELMPERIDPRLLLDAYKEMAVIRESIGDDCIPVAEALLGIPWLEAICGCRVMVVDGKSLWAEKPVHTGTSTVSIPFDPENPWLNKLLDVLETVSRHAAGKYAVGFSHLRGPADVLAALWGTDTLFLKMFDDPTLVQSMALEVAAIWKKVIHLQEAIIPRFRGGYGVRQFGLWAPEAAPWLQDDTSSMVSKRQYQKFFLPAFTQMAFKPFGTLHLHVPSLHLAEMFANVPNVRAVNIYFDDLNLNFEDTLPVLQRLQMNHVPLILAKSVYEGFSMEEYLFMREHLSPNGLSIHVHADSHASGRDLMGLIRENPWKQIQW